MKKILFVVLPYNANTEITVKHKLRDFVAHPYGVLSIATYLKRNTDAVIRICDMNIDDNLIEEVTAFNPDIVAVSMMFDSSYGPCKTVARRIKDWNSNVLLVLGGAAATASYQTILNEVPEIDAVCYGEGERAFKDLILFDAMDNISWAIRCGKKPEKRYLKDLDEVIDIDYSFINPDRYPMQESFSPFASTKKQHHQFFVVTSRGCPFNCKFCMNSADPDKTMRYASVDKVIEHIRKLVTDYGMDVLTFYDDQLLFNKKRAKELFRRLAEFNLRIECPNGLSVAFIDDELARLMKAAGMDTVNLAIESGSPHVLNNIIHKPLKINQVKPVVDILHKYGFWINAYIVLGLPGETDEHRKETETALLNWGVDWACIANAWPARGSMLYKECIENKYIPKDIPVDKLDMNTYIITTPSLEPKELMKQSYLMNLTVNFIHNHRYRTGDYWTAMQAFINVLERYPDQALAYYMIGKCSERLFYEKIEKNPEWKEYAGHFGAIP
jgi:radical SAM superfamily enzyme YgiQ (UPF0313 family)